MDCEYMVEDERYVDERCNGSGPGAPKKKIKLQLNMRNVKNHLENNLKIRDDAAGVESIIETQNKTEFYRAVCLTRQEENAILSWL